MARIDRHGAWRAEIDVAEAEHHVAGLEDDVPHIVAAGEAIDTLDEVDIVRQPRRAVPHGLPISRDSVERGGILERHRQMHHARRQLHGLDRRQALFGCKQSVDQRLLMDRAAVVVDL